MGECRRSCGLPISHVPRCAATAIGVGHTFLGFSVCAVKGNPPSSGTRGGAGKRAEDLTRGERGGEENDIDRGSRGPRPFCTSELRPDPWPPWVAFCPPVIQAHRTRSHAGDHERADPGRVLVGDDEEVPNIGSHKFITRDDGGRPMGTDDLDICAYLEPGHTDVR